MYRRDFLSAALGASAALAIGGSTGAVASEAREKLFVTARTSSGILRGVSIDGIKQFRGVPYGASTAGRNRFMPPKPVKPWSGVRDAYGYGEITPQPYSTPTHPFGDLIDFDLHVGAMGEDCLNLNVWTPGLDNAKRPVLVYYHGGGMSSGSANHDLYVGDRLARFGDAVVVTVNHRLSAFGYIDLVDLGAPEEFAHAGVAGLLDLVQSLEWVRENIEQFGGDPARVTIFGQSGGGTKVAALMAMPAARGLFHRAAIQSASLGLMTREEGARSTEALLEHLGVRRGQWRKLQELSAEALVEAQLAIGTYDWISGKPQTGPSPQFSPVYGGSALPTELTAAPAIANAAGVPLIIGYCQADSGWPMSNFDLDDVGLLRVAEQLAGAERAQTVFDEYCRAYPNASPFIIQGVMMTDATLLPRVTQLAQARASRQEAGTWVYRFDWPSQALGGRFGATHGMDMSLVFHNTHQPTLGGVTPQSREMADKMSSAWINFAAKGEPSTELLPEWRPYSVQGRETMLINHPLQRLVNDPNRAARLLWNDIAQRRNART